MKRRNRPSSPSRHVEVEYKGAVYAGSYTVDRGVITVSSMDFGTRATQVGGTPPDALAQILLRELVMRRKS